MKVEKHTAVMRRHLDLAGRRGLDIGCGAGALIGFLRHVGCAAWGLDPGPQQLARAAADPALAGCLVAGTGESLPFADGSFDLAIFFNSLHHVPVPAQAQALAEAARVLRPGGHLYAMEPIAEGALQRLSQPINDETEVRAAARARLDAASKLLPLTLLAEEVYGAPYGYRDFAAWKAETLSVDPGRAEKLALHEPAARAVFEGEGDQRDGKTWFVQPSRLHLFVRH